MFKKSILAASFALIFSGAAFAAGPHEVLECVGCHDIHDAKGPILFKVAPNTKAMPEGAANSKAVAVLCLSCHSTSEMGGEGIDPIDFHKSHPFGGRVNPKVANVPQELLRNGTMDCVSCHDPHPSNTNYKYLRVNTDGGKNMQDFCQMCHASKVDRTAMKKVQIFDSMDEEAAVSQPAVQPAAAPSGAPSGESQGEGK